MTNIYVYIHIYTHIYTCMNVKLNIYYIILQRFKMLYINVVDPTFRRFQTCNTKSLSPTNHETMASSNVKDAELARFSSLVACRCRGGSDSAMVDDASRIGSSLSTSIIIE